MKPRVRPPRLLLGAAAYVPGLSGTVVNRGTGGSTSAAYCYGVWLKHLTLLHAGADTGEGRGVPQVVAELGPGDSIGVGLAALLSGASTYYALDIKRFSTAGRNLAVLDELIELFSRRAPHPGRNGWPDVTPHLDERGFPSRVLTDEVLSRALAPRRLDQIRQALVGGRSDDGKITINYQVPWTEVQDVARGSVDLIMSHSVMEHVRNLDETYAACASWLRPGGRMTHQIDFTSHGLAAAWNGYWGYASERYWAVLAGRRDCWINRQPVSVHLQHLHHHGFVVTSCLRRVEPDGITAAQLAPRWRHLTEDDRTCSGALVQVVHPGA